MDEPYFLIPIFLILGAVVAVVMVVSWLWMDFRNRRQEKIQESLKNRKLDLDAAAFRQYYGCDLPPPLRQLYEDPMRTQRKNRDVRLPKPGGTWRVACFVPIDRERLTALPPRPGTLYCFATDGRQNRYLVDPRQADPTVCFQDHTTDELKDLRVSLSLFLSSPATLARGDDPARVT